MNELVLLNAVNEVESEGFEFIGADNDKVSKTTWSGREFLRLSKNLGAHRNGTGMKAMVGVVQKNPDCDVVGIYINAEYYFVKEREN